MAALTSGQNAPSSRLRVRQHIAPLARLGILVHECIPFVDKYEPVPEPLRRTLGGCPPRLVNAMWRLRKLTTRLPGLIQSQRAEVTWLERLLLPGLLTLEPFLSRPIVFDVDDAIWLLPPNGRKAVESVARRAAMVLAGNDYLADYLSQFTKNIRVIPTAVDTEMFRSLDRFRPTEKFTIGWTGTSGNFPYLKEALPAIKSLLAEIPESRLLVVADRNPELEGLPPERVIFTPWSPGAERAALGCMDVGIMPLPDSEWTRGKCAFKMLLYMTSGLPVVASSVGVVPSILGTGNSGFQARNQDEWFDALRVLAKDPDLRRTMGQAGRTLVETRYSVDLISNELSKVFSAFL